MRKTAVILTVKGLLLIFHVVLPYLGSPSPSVITQTCMLLLCQRYYIPTHLHGLSYQIYSTPRQRNPHPTTRMAQSPLHVANCRTI